MRDKNRESKGKAGDKGDGMRQMSGYKEER